MLPPLLIVFLLIFHAVSFSDFAISQIIALSVSFAVVQIGRGTSLSSIQLFYPFTDALPEKKIRFPDVSQLSRVQLKISKIAKKYRRVTTAPTQTRGFP